MLHVLRQGKIESEIKKKNGIEKKENQKKSKKKEVSKM